MIRPVLAISAGILCALLGLRQARQITDAEARLHRWSTLLRHLALLLAESTLPLPEALTAAASAREAPDEALRALAALLRDEPLSPIEALWPRLNVTGAEAAPLSRLIPRLTRGSVDSRTLAAQQAADELALLAESARGRSASDARMWRTLGLTCGLCLTLMLL